MIIRETLTKTDDFGHYDPHGTRLKREVVEEVTINSEDTLNFFDHNDIITKGAGCKGCKRYLDRLTGSDECQIHITGQENFVDNNGKSKARVAYKCSPVKG